MFSWRPVTKWWAFWSGTRSNKYRLDENKFSSSRFSSDMTMLAPILDKSLGGPFAKKAKVITIPQCAHAKELDGFLDRVSCDIWTLKNPIQMMREKRKIKGIWGHACLSILDTPGLIESLRAEKFDAAFAESRDVCGPVIFHLLGIEKWAVTEPIGTRDSFAITQSPSNPAYVPAAMASAGEKMTFFERLANSFTFAVIEVMSGFEYNEFEAVIRDRLPDLPSLTDILSANSLVFINSEPLINFPKPSSARVVEIGGISLIGKGPKPLNETWSSILDLRPNTILLSLGSLIKSFAMPEEYKRTIRETFKKFPDVTFIWKYERPEDNITAGVPNLIESTWVPQNDLLHDARLTAFITHGGQGSLAESIDAGVPAIVIPVFVDQPRNARLVERNGMGIRLEKGDLEREGRLGEAIREILINDRYQQKARKIQQMIADRPFHMKEIFVRNMEFLGKHGPLRQLDHYGRHLNFLQYYLIDVISFVLIFALFICCAMFIICRVLISKLFSFKAKRD